MFIVLLKKDTSFTYFDNHRLVSVGSYSGNMRALKSYFMKILKSELETGSIAR